MGVSQLEFDGLWTSHGRLVTESRVRSKRDRPVSVYINGQGYEYVEATWLGKTKVASIHQLTELAKDREPECDVDCPCSRRGPCPWRVFSNGACQVHHRHAIHDHENELARLLRRFNWPGNLELLEESDHNSHSASERWVQPGGAGHAP